MTNYIHHNKCLGGRAEEDWICKDDGTIIGRKTFCLGRYDCDTEYTTKECQKCPRFINGAEHDKWFEEKQNEKI